MRRSVGLVVLREHARGGELGGVVHAHVERRVLRVGEAALRLVELQRGDAEVEQDPGDPGDAEVVEGGGQFVVDGVHEVHAVAEPREPLPRERQRVPVAVEPDQLDAVEALEERLGVAAEAECRVDDDGARRGQRRREQLDACARGGRGCGWRSSHGRGPVPRMPIPIRCDLASGK